MGPTKTKWLSRLVRQDIDGTRRLKPLKIDCQTNLLCADVWLHKSVPVVAYEGSKPSSQLVATVTTVSTQWKDQAQDMLTNIFKGTDWQRNASWWLATWPHTWGLYHHPHLCSVPDTVWQLAYAVGYDKIILKCQWFVRGLFLFFVAKKSKTVSARVAWT